MLLRLVAACVLLLSSSGLARADASWERVSQKNGLLVERRKMPGSPYDELRGRIHTALPPVRLAAALWTDRKDGRIARRYRKKREVLRETHDERLVYEQVRAPVVSDREYTVRFKRSHDATTGVYRFDFHTDNAAGPPPDPRLVRLDLVRGAWTLTPASDGGCDVDYVVHSEPGGGIPAWIVRGPQVDSLRDLIVEVLEYAATHPELKY